MTNEGGRHARWMRWGVVLWGSMWLTLSQVQAQSLPARWFVLPEALSLSVGLRIWLGTPANQVGLDLRAAYRWRMLQINGGTALMYNFSHLGPRPSQPGPEWQTYLGVVAGFGPRLDQRSPFLHPLSHQTGRRYAVGYALKGYLDAMHTSQITGMLGLQVGPWSILSENDAYTGRLDDRFRTGTLAVAYQRDSLRLGLSCILWTGDPRSEGVERIADGEVGRFGYKDLSQGIYGKFSHGILALEASYLLPYDQMAQLRVGIDAEQIRDGLQNRFIHDLPYLPERWVSVHNPHYPPLTKTGEPYLGRPEQRIRPARPYLQIGLNPGLFY
jgi:hypothetical protein